MNYIAKLAFFITLLAIMVACSEPASQASINADRFFQNVSMLASDEFGGRAPMSEGEGLTLDFLANQFQEAGLEPLFNGRFRQPVPLTSLEVDPASAYMSFRNGDEVTMLTYADQYVSFTHRVEPGIALEDSEIVFVGYGVVAPEYGWNDYEGIDMAGKTALVLVNDPGFDMQDDDLFKGRAMTYYGRWIYKLEEAARQGAAAAIVVHETEAASYGWDTVRNSWTGPGFVLPPSPGATLPVKLASWIQLDVANQLAEAAGLEFESLKRQALEPAFKARPLGIMMSAGLQNTIVRGQSYNVGGVIRGSEAPDEAFVYTAHWDHIGTGHSDDPNEDVIYNGAIDNATGTAALIELAHAFKAMENAPRRSVVFLAVTAEESGKLGSLWYAENPVFPMNKTVGGVNMDAMPAYGPMKDIMVVGHDASELEDILVEAAALQDREVKPEPNPERGSYYRSDHFSFAKKGVPMLYAKAGTEHREKGTEYIREQSIAFIANRYHQPADEVQEDWDLRGIMEDIGLYFEVGRTVTTGNSWPKWRPGNEFRATREASLRK